MLLFDESDLFTTGCGKKKSFDLPNLGLMLMEGFIPRYGAAEEAGGSALPWTPELLALRHRVEKETGMKFNAVLLNLYRNGNDSVAWHSDKEHLIGQNPNIASVTFGQTRPFRLRHKTDKFIAQLEVPLHHGTLLLMSGATNTFWEHHIPKSAKEMLPRINLTFRQVRFL